MSLSISSHRICAGLIHDNYFNAWSTKLIKEFNEDFDLGEDDKEASKTQGKGPEGVKETVVTGPLNLLYPTILANML
jgi:hypothetical protein